MSTRRDPEDGLPPASAAAWTGAGGLPLPEPPSDPDVRYALGGELGRGGMGIVRAARDTWLDRDVAIKRPRPDLGEDARAHVMREARLTSRLSHPSIVPILDVGEDADGPYYTMPVLVGRTLAACLDDAVPHRTAVEALTAAARALGHAHRRGLVHRDVKPANLLLGDDGEVWVLDWGVAFDAEQPDRARVGTTGYRAPEADTAVPAPSFDVFGLGRTLERIEDAHDETHPELRAIAARCTRREPRDRYVDGGAVAEELERWLEGERVRAHTYTAREVLRRALWQRRRALALTAGLAGLALLAGAFALRAQQHERARGDRALARALAQQSATLLAQDARAEAEIVAAHALAVAEEPLARGVWMASSGTSRGHRVGAMDPPCHPLFLQSDGTTLCATRDLSVHAADGGLQWRVPLEGDADDAILDARRYERGILVHHASNRVAWWTPSGRAWEHPDLLGRVVLARGPDPAVAVGGSIHRVDADGGLDDGRLSGCEVVETLVTHAEGWTVGCRQPRLARGTWSSAAEVHDLRGSPSTLSTHWVGTFEGAVEPTSDDDHGWSPGTGPVEALLELPGGRVAVLGERGQTHVWDPTHHTFLASLPRGATQLARTPSGLRLAGPEGVEDFALPDAPTPVHLDRAERGGVSYLRMSPSGDTILVGSATGEVAIWSTRDGAVRVLATEGSNVAKGGAFVDDDHVVHTQFGTGLVTRDLHGTPVGTPVGIGPRTSHRTPGGQVLLLPWSPGVVWLHRPEDRIPLPARALAAAGGDPVWVADERGGVHTVHADRTEARFQLDRPTKVLATLGDGVLTADGPTLTARDATGAVRWTWQGSADVTAVAADDHHVLVGDDRGHLVVLGPRGTVVAWVPAHQRQISGIVVRDGDVFTASWDGMVRRWSLADVSTAAHLLVAEASRRWGRDLEAALASAAPR